MFLAFVEGALKLSDEEWKKRLNSEQYRVLREHGTEPPFRNAYWNNKETGTYTCAGCGAGNRTGYRLIPCSFPFMNS